jgi:hypothetical protein
MRKPFFAFAFRLGDVGTGKEAGLPNRMIEFEGFVGVSWTGQSALEKASFFLVIF